jgi:hypothetical protein
MEHEKPPREKAEDRELDIKTSPEYRPFKRLLKQVIKAPPLRKTPKHADT